MAAKQENTAQKDTGQLLPVEQLRERYHVAPSVFAGVCAETGWRPGRCVADKEFEEAVQGFLKAGMAPPVKQKEVKR